MEPHAGLTRWLIEHSGGALKDEGQAAAALLVFVALGIIFSLYMFTAGATRTPQSGPVPAGQVVPQ